MRIARRARANVYDAGVFEVLNKPRVAVYRAVVQSIPNLATTLVSWDTLEYDTDGMFDSAAPTRITARTAGIYLFNATIGFSTALAAGYRYGYFNKNATILYWGQAVVYDRDAVSVNWNMSAQISLNAGDYITCELVQNSGGALNTAVSSSVSRQMCLQACLISSI